MDRSTKSALTMDDSSGRFDVTTSDVPVNSILATFQIVYYIFSQFGWVIPVCLGIPGNIISIFVANRKRNKNISPCIYMTAMATADTIMLVQQWLLFPFPATMWGLGAYIQRRDILFKFVWYVVYTAGMLSGFFLAEMSIDRLIAVKFPMSAPTMCTVDRAKKTVIISAIFIIIINLNVFFTMRYLKDPLTGIEILIISVPDHEIVELLTSGFLFVFGTLCPFLIISISNLIIIVTVRSAAKNRKKLNQTGTQSEKQSKDTVFMTRMLVFVSVAYVLTSLPYRMYHVVMDIPEVSAIYDMSDPYWNYRYNIMIWVFFDWWCWNYFINFYLYCVGGGQRYRDDTKEVLKQLVRCACCRKSETA